MARKTAVEQARELHERVITRATELEALGNEIVTLQQKTAGSWGADYDGLLVQLRDATGKRDASIDALRVLASQYETVIGDGLKRETEGTRKQLAAEQKLIGELDALAQAAKGEQQRLFFAGKDWNAATSMGLDGWEAKRMYQRACCAYQIARVDEQEQRSKARRVEQTLVSQEQTARAGVQEVRDRVRRAIEAVLQ